MSARDDARNLADAIECAGYEPRAYSGRGMSGRECLAFELEMGVSLLKAAAMVTSSAYETGDDGERVAGLLCAAAYDSLGLGTIVYFPRIPYAERAE
jgi:hypothetical protein